MNDSPSRLSHPEYRADIDGLRAVAVLAVVAFHAFPGAVTGGFIGVDVFFVISGFLISTIIVENLERGAFTFGQFYARRIRRIFPALLVLLVACLGFGWVALLSGEFMQLGTHTAAGAGFVSNWVLWAESGYFDNESATKPLQHLWSLGVEEQFYVFWPLMLWTAWKARLNLLAVMVFVALASFILNIYGVDRDPVATFYLPLTRFWELLCGGMLAWLQLHPPVALERLLPSMRNALSVVGTVMLVTGAIVITPANAFPGWWAVLPVLGAVLVIVSGRRAWINGQLFSSRLLVWFGLISYPLYLWHWPLLSLARIVEGEIPVASFRVGAVLLSVLLAWLTWRLVEQPLRFGAGGRTKAWSLVLAMLVVGSLGLGVAAEGGLPGRAHAAVLAAYEGDTGHGEFHKVLRDRFHPCLPKQLADDALRWEGFARCAQSKQGMEGRQGLQGMDVDVALVGDSHAEHLFIGLAEQLPERNVAYYIRNSTRPFIGNREFSTIYAHVLASRTIKTVILTQYWAGAVNQYGSTAALEDDVLQTADALIRSGKAVYVTDDVPAFSFAPEKCKGMRWPYSMARQVCDSVDLDQGGQVNPVESVLRHVLARDPRIRRVDTRKYFCHDSRCSMVSGSRLLYRDFSHLNVEGSRFLARQIVRDHPELLE